MSNDSGLLMVGLDMGGTHIDGVIIKDGKVYKTIKRVVDKNDLFGYSLNRVGKAT